MLRHSTYDVLKGEADGFVIKQLAVTRIHVKTEGKLTLVQ